MDPFLIVVLIVAVLVLVSNWSDITRALKPPKPQTPPEQIDTGEFTLLKPAGFESQTTTYSGGRRLFAAEIYSETKSGAIGTVGGKSVQEEFNDAWAVVSKTPGDVIETCRRLAKHNATAVLDESEETLGRNRVLTITVVKRSAHFPMETTHKAIASSDRRTTYELRATVLQAKKAAYDEAIAAIVASFQLV